MHICTHAATDQVEQLKQPNKGLLHAVFFWACFQVKYYTIADGYTGNHISTFAVTYLERMLSLLITLGCFHSTSLLTAYSLSILDRNTGHFENNHLIVITGQYLMEAKANTQ